MDSLINITNNIDHIDMSAVRNNLYNIVYPFLRENITLDDMNEACILFKQMIKKIEDGILTNDNHERDESLPEMFALRRDRRRTPPSFRRELRVPLGSPRETPPFRRRRSRI